MPAQRRTTHPSYLERVVLFSTSSSYYETVVLAYPDGAELIDSTVSLVTAELDGPYAAPPPPSPKVTVSVLAVRAHAAP